MRVVSLLPSSTEILYAIGVEPVGVSHECDYPPDAQQKPVITSSKVEGDGSSADINQEVAEASEDSEGVYVVDKEKLEELNPDLIITQGVCDVCAVDSVVVEKAVDEISPEPEILTLHPHSLGDILDDIERVGGAIGKEEEAEEAVENLESRIDYVEGEVKKTDSRPRVVVLDWLDPVMVAGHWVPECVEIAGGEYGMAEPGERSYPREWSEVLEYGPEILVAAPCGFELRQTVANFDELSGRENWDSLPAVKAWEVYAMDGHNYINRPGPRIVDSLEYLAQVIHPDVFGDAPETVVQRPMRIR